MSNSDAIEHVQSAEMQAKNTVAAAEKRKAEKIQKASEKARQMVEEAEAQARQLKDGAVKKAAADADKERSRKLTEAGAWAKKVGKQELSQNKVKSIVEKVVRQIFG